MFPGRTPHDFQEPSDSKEEPETAPRIFVVIRILKPCILMRPIAQSGNQKPIFFSTFASPLTFAIPTAIPCSNAK